MQKRSGCPLINCTQSFDHDWLQLLYQVYNVTYFRLLAKSCHYYDYVVRRYRFASQNSAQSFYLLFLFFTIGIKDPEGFGKKLEENIVGVTIIPGSPQTQRNRVAVRR